MRNFSIGDLGSWEPLALGASISIPGVGGPRTVRFALNASGRVQVYVTDDEAEERLVCVGEGLMRVKFTAFGVVSARVDGEAGTEVFLQQRSEVQVIADSQQASFTTIEPRGVGPSEDLKRIMLYMRLNEQRREAQLQADRERLQKQLQEDRERLQSEYDKLRSATERPVEAAPAESAGDQSA